MLISRGRCLGSTLNTVGRPCGSAWVVTSPRGLWNRNSRVRSRTSSGLPSTGDAVGLGHVERRRADLLAVDADPPGGDPGLRLTPRGEPGARDHLGDAFTLVLPTFVALARHDSGLIAEAAARVLIQKRVHARLDHAMARGDRSPMPCLMDLALDEARAAVAAGEVPVGCGYRARGEVVAMAGNRTLADLDPTAHSEMLAIRRDAAALAVGTTRRLRSLRDARTLPDVRGGD